MKKLISLAGLILLTNALFGTVTFKNNVLVFENEQLVNKLSFQGGKIVPVSFYYKALGREALSSSADLPSWFEFVVNNKVIKSDDPVWKYRSHSVRKLINGGEEVSIIVEALQVVKGLQVEISRQFFPNSTLIRERIRLKANHQSFTLNKLNGKLHFVFPRYALASASTTTGIRETRIATFASEILDSINPTLTYDERLLDNTRAFNLANCHMFHPKINESVLQTDDTKLLKGPFALYKLDGYAWLSTYEHASQDENYAIKSTPTISSQPKAGSILIDQQQGVSGNSGLIATKDDFWFLGLQSIKTENSVVLSINQLRGGYLEGEIIDKNHAYETVWAASSVMKSESDADAIIHHYLISQITEHPPSRKSHFYYNTWGMQRDNMNKIGLRDIFTQERILKEIQNAAELKVDLFVLDDGWEETMGVWRPHKTRLPNGLKPLVDEMKKNNIIPGIWLSPMGIDSLSDLYLKHPEWVIRDEEGKPIKAQWDFSAFDFVSGFYDLFLNDCKVLVDQGIRFFKFDAINTFDSTLPNLHHGNSSYSKQEIRDRYAYLLPFYVTRLMRELRQYHPEVVVEIDLTEKERCIIGLMPLQEGKFFWMNNGASGYNDYSTYRTKSMRTVLNKFAGILPTELLTQAVYPHNEYPFFAQRYNVNTTLAGGRGFWGNLEMMKPEQRIRAGKLVEKSKSVLPYIQHLPLEVSGQIGSSPEVYIHLNREKAVGQVLAFSGTAIKYPVTVNLNTENCLGVLNQSYSIKNKDITLPFEFNRPDDSREAFILPNQGSGIRIESSTGWIDNIFLDLKSKSLQIIPGNAGNILIRLPASYNSITFNDQSLSPVNDVKQSGFAFYTLSVSGVQPQQIFWK